jgi:hypothetical protein
VSPDGPRPGRDPGNVNCRCAAAAFTRPPEPEGFVVLLCQLARRLSLVCHFCSPDQVRGWLLPSASTYVHDINY